MSRNSYSPAYFSLVPDRLNEKNAQHQQCMYEQRERDPSQPEKAQQHTLCEQIHAAKNMLKRPFLFIFICSFKRILYLDTK